ncbi:MAG: phosphotransferase [Pseudomonadales bacterium]
MAISDGALHTSQVRMNKPFDPAFKHALREWRTWPVDNEPDVIKQFDAGLNHKTALIKAAEKTFVLKVFLSNADKALAAQYWAAAIDVSPAIIFQSDKSDYCLMEYVGANSLAGRSIDDGELQALATSLNTMHSTPAESIAKISGEFDIFYWCNQYLPTAGDCAKRIHLALQEILGSYEADLTVRCFCHNDLVAENCFIQQGKAVFIDWEFAQWHNPWFDLASIIYYLKLDTGQSRLFLKTYCSGFEEKVAEDIFLTSQIALLWGDMLWHLAMYGESFWPALSNKMRDLQGLARQLDTELPTPTIVI